MTYISKTIQNEMISTVGAIIVNNLSQEIRDSKYFSIMSDEAADISNKQNLSVVIRFLDSTKTVREEFVGFCLCEDILYVLNPDHYSHFIGILRKVHFNPPKSEDVFEKYNGPG